MAKLLNHPCPFLETDNGLGLTHRYKLMKNKGVELAIVGNLICFLICWLHKTKQTQKRDISPTNIQTYRSQTNVF